MSMTQIHTGHGSPLCHSVQQSFSGYLDGTVSGQEMRQIADHLDSCPGCAREFAALRSMQDSLAMLRPARAPEDLGLKLRLAISRERSRRHAGLFDSLSVQWENAIRPLLVQVSAGLATTIVLLGGIVFLLGTVAAPQAVLANDEPLGALTVPHYLYSAAEQRPILTGLDKSQNGGQDATIVVEAQVNAEGRVYDYTIVSGPQDATVRSQVADQLLLCVFEPAYVFGAPVRGRILLIYDGVSVRA